MATKKGHPIHRRRPGNIKTTACGVDMRRKDVQVEGVRVYDPEQQQCDKCFSRGYLLFKRPDKETT